MKEGDNITTASKDVYYQMELFPQYYDPLKERDYTPFASNITNPPIRLRIRWYSLFDGDETWLASVDYGHDFTKAIEVAKKKAIRRKLLSLMKHNHPKVET